MIGVCKLCDQNKQLRKSHAIGRTVFNRVLRKADNNTFLNISPRLGRVKQTNDQWATFQLCLDCEDKLNRQYDNYGIKALRGDYDSVKITKFPSGWSFNGLNQERVLHYVISILWRAAHSTHSAYDGVTIPDELDSYLKHTFLGNEEILKDILNVRIRVLKDFSQSISDEVWQRVLISPYVYKTKNNVIYVMMFEGWYIEVFFLKPSFKERKKHGYLRNGKDIFFAPYIEISQVPGLMHALAHGVSLVDSK